MGSPHALPAGTITLMFCDVEGSTSLARRLDDRWLEVLGVQRRLLRAAVAANHGVELAVEGDGLQAAFPRARDAVCAAADAQRGLAAYAWPADGFVRVRIGLHTGEPERTADGYEGLDMHRAARVMAAGHGGQVLLTGAVRETLGERLPAGLVVRDLGRHVLKDLPRPEHLFQLEVAGLTSTFPPVRAEGPHGDVIGAGGRGAPARVGLLPALASELVGRDGELDGLFGLLNDGSVRLVTVTGVGGVGKTSVAIAVAGRIGRRFSDGAAFVDLSAVRDPGVVADAMLAGLGGLAEAGSTASATLCRFLAPREQLLVIDNFEQVIDAAPLLADVLAAAPRLTMLVTSRFALDLRAEHRWPLDALGLPDRDDLAGVAQAPATALFIARATARDPAFEVDAITAAAITDVCARVGGLPLGIELAAARTRTLSVRQIASRLGAVMSASFGVGRDVPERQRTLAATLDWSYDLLDDDEREAYGRFGVFAGGCSIDAAERVAGASVEVIDGLLAKGMLMHRRTGAEARLVMQEVVREHAASVLCARGDSDVVGQRHSRYYLDYALAARPHLHGARQREWFGMLRAESGNLLLALEREREAGNREAVARLAVALELWWNDLGRDAEGVSWIRPALDADDGLPAELRAEALLALAYLSVRHSDFAFGLRCGREAVELYDALDDDDGASLALHESAIIHWFLNQLDDAQALAREALRRAPNGSRTEGLALTSLALALDDPGEAMCVAERAHALLEPAGDLRAQSTLWGNLGFLALERGDLDTARELIRRATALAERTNDNVNATYDLATEGLIALEAGDLAIAVSRLDEALSRSRSYGLTQTVPDALIGLAAVASRTGEHRLAVRLLHAGLALQVNEPPSQVHLRLRSEILNRSSRDAATTGPAETQEIPPPEREEAIAQGLQASERWLHTPALTLHGRPSQPDAIGPSVSRT